MKSTRRPHLLSLSIALALALPAAQAQTDADPDEAAMLDQIVVSARKVNEALQEVPVTVSAFTAEGIERRGIIDVNSLAEFTPGLSFSQAFGRSSDRPVIRGQGNVLANVLFGVESGTAYFLDGVYYNGDIQALDFDSLERIEVIKGPQSALYGRNTFAGAINFITREPSPDVWHGVARVTLAQHEEERFSASLDGPISPGLLSARIGVRYNSYGGEYTNQLTGLTVGQEEDSSVNATLLFTPTENLTMRAFAMYRDQNDGTLPLFLQGAEANNCFPGFRSIGYRPGSIPNFGGRPSLNNPNQYYCGVIAPQPNGIRLNTHPFANNALLPGRSFVDGTAVDGYFVNETFASLDTDYVLGDSGWELSSLIGYRANHDLFGADSDHSEAFLLFGPPGVAEPLFANTNRNDRREWSGELKLISPRDEPLQGLLGVYYYEIEDIETDSSFANPDGGGPLSNSIGINNRAIFGSLRYDFSDQLSGAVEVRYSQETKYREEYAASGALTLEQRGQYNSTTPRLTLDYQASDDLLIYGVLSQGVRPGGLNGSAGASTGRPTYEEEESDNFEIGFKSTLLDGRMRLNAAFFYIDSENVQVTQALAGMGAGGAVTSIAVNQAKAETKGVEVEMDLAITDDLSLSASAAYVDPEFTEGCDDFEFVLNSGGIAYQPSDFGSPECDISGNRLPLTSKTQASLLLNYERPLSNGWTFLTSSTYSYEGSKYVQVHNTAETGSTSLLGLRVGIRNENWSFVAFGRNLTDEDTIPLATRWFDLRYGSCAAGQPCVGPSGTAAADADRGSPRAFFASLRKGRTFGIEATYSF